MGAKGPEDWDLDAGSEWLAFVSVDPDAPGAGEPVRLAAVVPVVGPARCPAPEMLADALDGRLGRAGGSVRDRGSRGTLDLFYEARDPEAAGLAAEDLLFEAAGHRPRVWRRCGGSWEAAPDPSDRFGGFGSVSVEAVVDGRRVGGPFPVPRSVVDLLAWGIPRWAGRWRGERAEAFARLLAEDLSEALGPGAPTWWVSFVEEGLRIGFEVPAASEGVGALGKALAALAAKR